jgi:hypothetical protein
MLLKRASTSAAVAQGATFRASNTTQSQINHQPCAARSYALQIENAAAQIDSKDSL